MLCRTTQTCHGQGAHHTWSAPTRPATMDVSKGCRRTGWHGVWRLHGSSHRDGVGKIQTQNGSQFTVFVWREHLQWLTWDQLKYQGPLRAPTTSAIKTVTTLLWCHAEQREAGHLPVNHGLGLLRAFMQHHIGVTTYKTPSLWRRLARAKQSGRKRGPQWR